MTKRLRKGFSKKIPHVMLRVAGVAGSNVDMVIIEPRIIRHGAAAPSREASAGEPIAPVAAAEVD